ANRIAGEPANAALQIRAEYSLERGQILAVDERSVLAESVANPDPNSLYRFLRKYPGRALYGHLPGYYSPIYEFNCLHHGIYPQPARLQGVPGALPPRIDLQAGDGVRGDGERLGTGQDVAEPPRPEPAAVIHHAAELRKRDLPRRHHDGHDGTGVRAIVQRHVRTDRSSPRRRTALDGGGSLRCLPDPPAERGHVRGAADPVRPAGQ